MPTYKQLEENITRMNALLDERSRKVMDLSRRPTVADYEALKTKLEAVQAESARVQRLAGSAKAEVAATHWARYRKLNFRNVDHEELMARVQTKMIEVFKKAYKDHMVP
jgi:hypothetical protein